MTEIQGDEPVIDTGQPAPKSTPIQELLDAMTELNQARDACARSYDRAREAEARLVAAAKALGVDPTEHDARWLQTMEDADQLRVVQIIPDPDPETGEPS